MENFTCTLEKKCSQLGCGKGESTHGWGVRQGEGVLKSGGLLLLLLLMSSAVITRFHGLPMGEPATVRFVYVLFIFMCCCCCCCFRGVCVCLCFFFFGTFTLILSSSASVRFGSFRFGGFKYYVMFSARDKRHLFMSFWKFGLRQMERSISPHSLSLCSFSPRFALLM